MSEATSSTPSDRSVFIERLADLGTWSISFSSAQVEMSEGARKILLPQSLNSTAPINVLKAQWISDDQFADLRNELLRAIHFKTGFSHVQLVHRHSTENTVWVELAGEPILTEGGDLIGLRGIVRDVSWQMSEERRSKRVEAVLEGWRRQERLSYFTNRMAHDVANMLQPALTYCSLARDALELGHNNELKKSLESVESTIERSAARLRTGPNVPNAESSKLPSLSVREVIKDVLVFVPDENQKFIELRCPPELLDNAVGANRAGMVQVFVGLLDNAIEASEGKPEVVVQFDETDCGDFITFAMSDRGRGFDEEAERRAFDPFFTSNPDRPGMGLGLPMSKSIVERWGGTIEISNNQTVGATVLITLPKI